MDYRMRGIGGMSGDEKNAEVMNRKKENMPNIELGEGIGSIDANAAIGSITNPVASAAAAFFIGIVVDALCNLDLYIANAYRSRRQAVSLAPATILKRRPKYNRTLFPCKSPVFKPPISWCGRIFNPLC